MPGNLSGRVLLSAAVSLLMSALLIGTMCSCWHLPTAQKCSQKYALTVASTTMVGEKFDPWHPVVDTLYSIHFYTRCFYRFPLYYYSPRMIIIRTSKRVFFWGGGCQSRSPHRSPKMGMGEWCRLVDISKENNKTTAKRPNGSCQTISFNMPSKK